MNSAFSFPTTCCQLEYRSFACGDGSFYSGWCQSATNIPHGYGVRSSPDSWKYEGYFNNGQLTGFGILECLAIYPTHGGIRRYEGGFKDNLYHGWGNAEYFAGQGDDKPLAYNGGWSMGLPDGRGTAVYPDGTTYDGGWKMGVREGHGTIKYPDGRIRFEGGWKDGKYHGYGKLCETGRTYEGGW